MSIYDIAFVGHMCYDEITPYGGKTTVTPGSAILCGAAVAARIGKKVAVVTKMSETDKCILKPLKDIAIKCFFIPSPETMYSVVIHPSANVDERRFILKRPLGLLATKEAYHCLLKSANI